MKHLSNPNELRAFLKSTESPWLSLEPEALAPCYIDVALLQMTATFLMEQEWIRNQEHNKRNATGPHQSLVDVYAETELAPCRPYHNLLILMNSKNYLTLGRQTAMIEEHLLDHVCSSPLEFQKFFARETLLKLSDLFETVHQLHLQRERNQEVSSLSLYRSFDGLDRIFQLDYQAEDQLQGAPNMKERLYEGAGVGVQSAYSTLLTAIRYLAPKQGSRLIDLGSGYGRLGLVLGLMRPDISFTGYEFVGHRVDIAMRTSHNFQMQNHTQFKTQDLSAPEFLIPEAEIYYLFDPFSEATYFSVLKQLIAISKKQKITIVTKGNARGWLLQISIEQGWPAPEEFDGGNLCLFASA